MEKIDQALQDQLQSDPTKPQPLIILCLDTCNEALKMLQSLGIENIQVVPELLTINASLDADQIKALVLLKSVERLELDETVIVP